MTTQHYNQYTMKDKDECKYIMCALTYSLKLIKSKYTYVYREYDTYMIFYLINVSGLLHSR